MNISISARKRPASLGMTTVRRAVELSTTG